MIPFTRQSPARFLPDMRRAFGARDDSFEEAKHPQETFQSLLPEAKASRLALTFSRARNCNSVYNFVRSTSGNTLKQIHFHHARGIQSEGP